MCYFQENSVASLIFKLAGPYVSNLKKKVAKINTTEFVLISTVESKLKLIFHMFSL